MSFCYRFIHKIMNRRKNSSDSIPIDLLEEIFSRLPAKSYARFRSVSKLWASILHPPYFTELFLPKFSPRPCLLFAVVKDSNFSFFSSSSPLSTADFHMNFSQGVSEYDCSYVSGLIYFHMCIPEEDKDPNFVICNPVTGQYMILPKLRKVCMMSYSYLGFDPIDLEFKVLFMNTSDYVAYDDTYHYILTIGTGKMMWRKIQCPFTHEPFGGRICINGVLYYEALQVDEGSYEGSHCIVCFDVKYEEFKFVRLEFVQSTSTKLINFKGKLGVINLKYENDYGRRIHIWVLEDVEKHEWSKYVYTLRYEDMWGVYDKVGVVGMTRRGEIVLFKTDTFDPFSVFCVDIERNILQSVEIHGFGGNREAFETYREVIAFVDDYVEVLSVERSSKLLNSSLTKQDMSRPELIQRRHTSRDLCKSAPSEKNKQEKNKNGSLANFLYHFVGFVILFVLFYVSVSFLLV